MREQRMNIISTDITDTAFDKLDAVKTECVERSALYLYVKKIPQLNRKRFPKTIKRRPYPADVTLPDVVPDGLFRLKCPAERLKLSNSTETLQRKDNENVTGYSASK
jgi:hypothetical protein